MLKHDLKNDIATEQFSLPSQMSQASERSHINIGKYTHIELLLDANIKDITNISSVPMNIFF